ncbi:MAG: hypothetical protein AB8F74_02630 [Saprospiraceae bacterium]
MERKDYLKEILGEVGEVNQPVDLEGVIMNAIQEQENLELQIANYKAKGLKALIGSSILILVLGILFSFPGSVRTVEQSILTYTSIVLILLTILIQLEMGETRIFNKLKNNLQ